MSAVVYKLDTDNIDIVAKNVASSLLEGGVCIIPTDTIYGIVALENNSHAIDRIYKIKRRPREKEFIRLIESPDDIKRYTDQKMPPELAKYWPGPLTVIFKSRKGGTVALRNPDSPFLNRLFTFLEGRAIVAPSANISGDKDIRRCDELIKTFGEEVDIIVCSKSEPEGRASTIIDISSDKGWRIVRKGDISISLDGLKMQ